MTPVELWRQFLSRVDFSNPVHVLALWIVAALALALVAACCVEFDDWTDGL